MAKKLGKKNQKSGFDGRDWFSVVGYLIVLVMVGIQFMSADQNKKQIDALEAESQKIEKDRNKLKDSSKDFTKDLKTWRAKAEDSKAKIKREETEYEFVVGTSLEYAKKSKLLMAIWEAIGQVRNLALRTVFVEKNSVKLELLTPSDLYLTEFMAELNKRRDLVDSIQIVETKTEKADDKGEKEVLVGNLTVIAKRPSTAIHKDDKPLETPAPVDVQAKEVQNEGAKPEGETPSDSKGSKRKTRKK